MFVQNHQDAPEPEDIGSQQPLDIDVNGSTTSADSGIAVSADHSITDVTDDVTDDIKDNMVDLADQYHDRKLDILAEQFVPEIQDLSQLVQRLLNGLNHLVASDPTPAVVERYISDLILMLDQVSSGLYPSSKVMDAVKIVDALLPQLFSRGLSAPLLDALYKLPNRLNGRYSVPDQVDIWAVILHHLSYAAITNRVNAVVNIIEGLRQTAVDEQNYLHGINTQLFSLLDTDKTADEVEHIRLQLESYARASGDDRLALQLQLALAWHHAMRYRGTLARDHAMNAYTLATALADKRSMVKAALYLSNALTLLQDSADHPDYQQADQYLDEAEIIAKETDDLTSLRYITLNRCNLLYNRGKFDECTKLAEKTAGFFVEVPGMQSRLKYLRGMSYRDSGSEQGKYKSLRLLKEARDEFISQGALDDVLNCEFAIAKWKAKFSRITAAMLHMNNVVLPLLNKRDPTGIDHRRHEFKL